MQYLRLAADLLNDGSSVHDVCLSAYNDQDLLSELNIGPNKHRIARLAIMLAMDRHNAQRELTSRLISDLYRTVFSSSDIALCFSELLSSIDDIVLDTPDAHNVIASCT